MRAVAFLALLLLIESTFADQEGKGTRDAPVTFREVKDHDGQDKMMEKLFRQSNGDISQVLSSLEKKYSVEANTNADLQSRLNAIRAKVNEGNGYNQAFVNSIADRISFMIKEGQGSGQGNGVRPWSWSWSSGSEPNSWRPYQGNGGRWGPPNFNGNGNSWAPANYNGNEGWGASSGNEGWGASSGNEGTWTPTPGNEVYGEGQSHPNKNHNDWNYHTGNGNSYSSSWSTDP